jgi:transposase
MHISTIGLDIAKSVFQVHGVDNAGQTVLRKRLRRAQMLPFFQSLPACLIGIEACGSSQYWARQLIALGHNVKLMPPAYVKPFVKRNKTDAADAEAICEAVTRPSMRFVPVKTPEQQSILMLHRVRSLLIRQRTMAMNALRGHLSELGIVAPQGERGLMGLIIELEKGAENDSLPKAALAALTPLVTQLANTKAAILATEKELLVWHRQSLASRRLETIPGIGFITASAIASAVPDPKIFTSGRQFAAWLGLVPRQRSSGGKERSGSISKMGDTYLRTLLVIGATSIIRYARSKAAAGATWITALLARRPARLVTVAVANKTARIAWTVMAEQREYRNLEVRAA